MNPEVPIRLDDVSFGYGAEPVLDHVSLALHRGDFLGVIGPNGGGKTTLIKIMLGLLKPTRGEVFLLGEPIGRFRQWPKIGYVPQRATQLDMNFPITVEEVAFLGRVAKVGLLRRFSARDRQAVLRALEEVGMQDFRSRLITELSGGQQQRVFIARALASEPDMLILDEPTVGVDINAQEQFYQLLAHLNAELGLTLVLVSHDIESVVNQVTSVACLNRQLVCHGNPQVLADGHVLERLYGRARKLIPHHH